MFNEVIMHNKQYTQSVQSEHVHKSNKPAAVSHIVTQTTKDRKSLTALDRITFGSLIRIS